MDETSLDNSNSENSQLSEALVCDTVTGICAPAGQNSDTPAAGRFTLPLPPAAESDGKTR